MRTVQWLVGVQLAALVFCLCGALVLLPACSDHNPTDVKTGKSGHSGLAMDIPPPSSPANLIHALTSIYNAGKSPAAERLFAYAGLFPPSDHSRLGFTFVFQPRDVEHGAPPSWGLEDELRSAWNMFRAQESGRIHQIELTLEIADSSPIEFEEAKQGWIRILATNVNLSVLTSPDDGLRVTNGVAEFQCAPDGDRWYITEWRDVPMNP